MAKQETLVIPAGLRFEVTPEGVSIEHDGDILLQGSPLPRLARVRSRTGDVIVQADVDILAIEAPEGCVSSTAVLRVGRLSAGQATLEGEVFAEIVHVEGALLFRGPVTATKLRGGAVSFEGPSVNVRSAEGEHSVHVGKTKIAADILIAPSVIIDAGATGRVKVLESLNDLGAHAVRGCLRLADLEDMGGNAAAFLAERGLKPLGDGGGRAEPSPPVQTRPDTALRPTPIVPPHEPSARVAPPPAPVPAQTVPIQVMPMPTGPGAASAPISAAAARRLGDELVSAVVEEVDEPPVDPIQRDIREALDKILSCYTEGELPPPIADLRDYVLQHDYSAVRDGIMQIWNQTLAWHKRFGPPRIHPQLSPNFNILNSLVRKL